MSGLFGGGGASKQAQADAQKSRDIQRVANERQLASLNSQNNATMAGQTRRAPRGRRLFEGDAKPGVLA